MSQILHKNLFKEDKELINMLDMVLNLEEKDLCLSVEEAVVRSENEKSVDNKNKFILIGGKSLIEELSENDIYRDFLKTWDTLRKLVSKNYINISVTILNMLPFTKHNSIQLQTIYFNEEDNLEKIKRDITLIHSLKSVSIFAPADFSEAKFLLKSLKEKNTFSYFRLSKYASQKIYDENYFDNKKVYNGLPEIIYLSKNLNSFFEITLIACGPILFNVLNSARELENKNFRVTVLNISTLFSTDEKINCEIKKFWLNFIQTHKNLLIVEEHSNFGGLGSIITEILSEERNLKIKRLGLEDDLTIRNIINEAERLC